MRLYRANFNLTDPRLRSFHHRQIQGSQERPSFDSAHAGTWGPGRRGTPPNVARVDWLSGHSGLFVLCQSLPLLAGQSYRELEI